MRLLDACVDVANSTAEKVVLNSATNPSVALFVRVVLSSAPASLLLPVHLAESLH